MIEGVGDALAFAFGASAGFMKALSIFKGESTADTTGGIDVEGFFIFVEAFLDGFEVGEDFFFAEAACFGKLAQIVGAAAQEIEQRLAQSLVSW